MTTRAGQAASPTDDRRRPATLDRAPAARGSETPRLDAERLLAHALGLERIELYMALDRPLTPAELDAARALVARRARASRSSTSSASGGSGA